MRRPGRRGIAAVTLVTVLTVALGAASATAAPAPPSWDDVEQARGDVEATSLAIARIEDAVRAAEAEYAAATRTAQMRGEDYQLAGIAPRMRSKRRRTSSGVAMPPSIALRSRAHGRHSSPPSWPAREERVTSRPASS